jgi:hypothetical protein
MLRNEDKKMDYYERQKELRQLAFIDEADSYEVDEAGIYLDNNGQFVLLTASGCSYWGGSEGEYSEEVYETLDALEHALINEDRTYNPSLNGAHRLLEEAKQNL